MNPKMRRKARRFAVQALYQWHLSGNTAKEIEQQFIEDNEGEKVDLDYFHELLFGVIQEQQDIDDTISPFLNRPLKEMDPVEIAVLRMATYELKHRIDVPYKVVINEALEQNKVFGSIEGYKYINAVIDKVAKVLRDAEHGKK